MFRSGSTLVESILSTKNDVYDLGETNILEEAFLEYKKSSQEIKRVASNIKVSEFFIFILTNLVVALNLLSMFGVD